MSGGALVRRVLPAPPDVVFDEWLDPVGMTEWMCPRPARAGKISLQPWVGGTLRIDISDGGIVTGQFVELDRPRRLRFTWSCSDWPDPTVQSMVTVSLEPHGDDETLMTIAHDQLPPEMVDDHQQGWTAIAAQLDAARRARELTPDVAGAGRLPLHFPACPQSRTGQTGHAIAGTHHGGSKGPRARPL
jgi:uncharacterized protein YndB with AHSA1/START domain